MATNTEPSRFLSRRGFLLTGAAMAGRIALSPKRAVSAPALTPTPRQTEGPFYPDLLPLDRDNDLLSVKGRSELAKGQVTHILGRVRDTDGRPIRQARIEIWQCDAFGRYIHSEDSNRGPRDRNFQGYGQTLTDADGRYRFRTIKPVPYSGRTPHIHFAVHARGSRRLTTQMYVKGEPRNDRDWLLRRIRDEKARHSIIVVLNDSPTYGADELEGEFNIVLSGGSGIFED